MPNAISTLAIHCPLNTSSIQTLLSVPELHRFGLLQLADYTAGRDLHPALKIQIQYVFVMVSYKNMILYTGSIVNSTAHVYKIYRHYHSLYFSHALCCLLNTIATLPLQCNHGCFVHDTIGYSRIIAILDLTQFQIRVDNPRFVAIVAFF